MVKNLKYTRTRHMVPSPSQEKDRMRLFFRVENALTLTLSRLGEGTMIKPCVNRNRDI
jgi:hypothetical protein